MCGSNCLLSYLRRLNNKSGFCGNLTATGNTLYSSLSRSEKLYMHGLIIPKGDFFAAEQRGGDDFANVEWMTLPASFFCRFVCPLFCLKGHCTGVRV